MMLMSNNEKNLKKNIDDVDPANVVLSSGQSSKSMMTKK